MAKETAFQLNVIEGLSFPLSFDTVSWCLGGLLCSHLEICVVDVVLAGCFVFKGWEKLFFSLKMVKDEITIISLFSASFL